MFTRSPTHLYLQVFDLAYYRAYNVQHGREYRKGMGAISTEHRGIMDTMESSSLQ